MGYFKNVAQEAAELNEAIDNRDHILRVMIDSLKEELHSDTEASHHGIRRRHRTRAKIEALEEYREAIK